jgi:hypothetical protein
MPHASELQTSEKLNNQTFHSFRMDERKEHQLMSDREEMMILS